MAFRYRLYPADGQAVVLARHCADARFVWNLAGKWAEVHIPKVGLVRFRLTRPLGAHGMARVTQDRAGRWHVSFSAPQPPVTRTATGTAVGVDLGVAHTVTTSAGVHLDIPGLRPGEQARLLRLERKKARQRKGSNRRARTKQAIAVLHARAADRRKDWAERTSTDLVRDHDQGGPLVATPGR